MTIQHLRPAVAHLDPPFAVLDRPALLANAADLVRRAGGVPIRLATKSVRVRRALTEILSLPGYAGLLTFTLPEALWLQQHGFSDLVVGYPTVDRTGLRALGSSAEAAATITLMVDDVAQLDLIDALLPPARRETVRVCLELDCSYAVAPGLPRVGAKRSPIRTPAQARALAEQIARRPGFSLVGLMGYEGQIAGVGDAGRGPRASAIRVLQRRSAAELTNRRAAVVAAVRAVADLEFVNGGGTGSLHTTRTEPAITELAAGSGLFAPALFDTYRAFRPTPAAYFVLPVVRKPTPDTVTLLGGGWIASGPTGTDRSPTVADPAGLHYAATEGAGEVQTPLRGRAARQLRIGDQVWLRHAKAGELSEHVDELQVVDGGAVAEVWPTYRGEGLAFL